MFRKWTAISTVASALQRKVRIEWGTSLHFYPNMYIILVGDSALGKGTTMGFAYDIIKELQDKIRLSAQATSLQALIRRLKDTNLTDIDITTGQQQYHSSLTIFSEEFTVFLGYHNRELMSSLCDWYDCKDRWSYETISRSREEIVGVWVNLLAGTTPDSLQSSLPIESIGGGLTSRIIFIYEEKKDKLVVMPTQTQEEYNLQQMLITDLEKISMMSGLYRYTENFANGWSDFCYYNESNPPFYDKKFKGYNGRRRTHVMKLSMIVSASKRDELVLTKDDLDDAIRLIVEAEINMSSVFSGVGSSDISGLLHEGIKYIKLSTTDEIPMYRFARHFEDSMDKFTMDRVLHTMDAMKLAKVIKKPGIDPVIKRLDDDRLKSK